MIVKMKRNRKSFPIQNLSANNEFAWYLK